MRRRSRSSRPQGGERMARVVLVLGGGGTKGLAHVGAWRAIREARLEVAAIVGTSIGALVGASIAGGMELPELERRGLALTKTDIVGLNRWALLLNGIRQPSVFRDEPFREYIRSVLPVESFDALSLPLAMNAVDLETGEQVWFGAGGRTDVTLADAVYASGALPLFYPPAEVLGRHLVDGGVADSLPISRAAGLLDGLGAERIIAVDVSAGATKDSLDTIAKGMVAVHHRVYDIMNYTRKRERLDGWDGPPLVYVRPALDGYSTFDFDSNGRFIEEGYRSTLEALGTSAAQRSAAV